MALITGLLQTVTGCLHLTPAVNLLAPIQPAGLGRKRTTLSLVCRATEPGHLLHLTLTCPLSGNVRHLKSIHPFVPAATTHQFIWRQHLNCGALDGSPMECRVVGEHYKTQYFHLRDVQPPPGRTLTRTAWFRLNGLRTCFRHSRSCLRKWGRALFAAWVWRRGTNRRQCRLLLSNPSTSPWTAQPDGSGW